MSPVIQFGDAQFHAPTGVILHMIDWLTEQLDPHNPVIGELTDAVDNNLAELDVRDTRYRPVINLLADRLPAHALAATDQELSQHLQQLGAAARRHRRRQLAIRSGDARARYRSLPPTAERADTHADVDTHVTEVEHGEVPDYNQGALPYLRILGWRW
jgi:hypothetical protein